MPSYRSLAAAAATGNTLLRLALPVALMVVLLAACRLAHSPPTSDSSGSPSSALESPWFEDEAASSGLELKHHSGASGDWLMPEIMSGGVALVDLDGDQLLDIYLVQGGRLDEATDETSEPREHDLPSRNRLYHNQGDGTFVDRTPGSGAGDTGYGMGVAAGDIEPDGDLDLYVTNVGANVLLRNDGDLRFSDITEAAGVGDPGWGASAAFFDADRDGDQDLIVINYLRWSITSEIECFNDVGDRDYCSPQGYDSPVPDILYRNNGDGTFSDQSASSGLADLPGTGLGVVVADFDGDRWPDVFVANDGLPDRLWINRGDGTFVDQALLAGCAVDLDGRPKAGMGVTVADIDNDGDPDLLVCNLDQESDSLFRNQNGFFTDTTAQMGLSTVSRPFTRFGMAWMDFDNDGHLDLYQANGRVAQSTTPLAADPFAEPNLLFRGLPRGGFEEVFPRGGTATPLLATSRAAAFGDLDLDGGVDIVVINRDGPVHLLYNRVPQRGHWMLFDLREKDGAIALGARLTFVAGRQDITREVRSAFSYQAANDPRIHVGLGQENTVRDIRVEWVDGEISAFGDLPADTVVTLHRGAEPKLRRGVD